MNHVIQNLIIIRLQSDWLEETLPVSSLDVLLLCFNSEFNGLQLVTKCYLNYLADPEIKCSPLIKSWEWKVEILLLIP